MVLIWAAIAVGIILAVILIAKIAKTPSHEAIKMNSFCKKCGYKTNGLKCPRCEKSTTFSNKFK